MNLSNWTKGHSAVVLGVLAVLFMHIKGAGSWSAAFTPESIGEMGLQALTAGGGLLLPSANKPTWDGTDRRGSEPPK